jgi:hypothetical protein
VLDKKPLPLAEADMKEPRVRWDGAHWVSGDGLWAWNGSEWIQFGSRLPVAGRAAIYAAVGLAINGPILFVLALAWGLTGPAWDASPPDFIGSIVQIALTVGAALLAFWASWFFLRIDRRDWWLGAVIAWPWIASAVVLTAVSVVQQPPYLTGVLLSALLLLFASVELAGSIVGRRMPSRASAASAQADDASAARLGRMAKATWTFLLAVVAAYIEAAGRR